MTISSSRAVKSRFTAALNLASSSWNSARMIRSPFTTAAVGMGVGEGGNGVRVGRISVSVGIGVSVFPLHPLTIRKLINKRKLTSFTYLAGFISLDYKRF